MKKIYALAFALFTIASISAQKIIYETTSKWFLGFNIGATWHQSDVKNVVSNGYGLVLGKSYNFDYGRVFSFDIRGRYLRGNFIGQDDDTTAIFASSANAALNPYLNAQGQGFTVHNFQTDIHRGAIELVLHLNALTERTGWDPYIFGGAGLTFRQTFGDLLDQNNNSLPYDYQAMLDNSSSLSSQLSTQLDKIYDTPLYGNADRYSVNFMPSWGFGLGYQIGKRVSLGIEHKITYTLRDDFDGLKSDVRLENDRHHYTSAYLNFRFRTRWRGDNTNSSGNVDNFNTNCPQPVINITSATGQNVQFPTYRLEATVNNLSNAQELILTNSSGQQFFFNYNPTTRRIEADLNLMEGTNNFTLRATNRCGTDTRNFSVIYTPCNITQIQFTNPANPQTIERNPNFRLTAFVSRVENANNIRLFHNNNPVFGFTFNRSNGSLSSNIFLSPGLNQFRIEAQNSCGTQTMSTSVTYDNCVEPTIQLVAPGATGVSVSQSNYTVRALLNNIERADQITFIHNNLSTNAFSFINGQLTYNGFLNPGVNNFSITAANNCGAKTTSFTVNLQTCQAPVISAITPAQNTSVNALSLPVRFRAEHITAKQNIQIAVNGVNWNNFNFNTANKEISGTVILQNGVNTITIQATNTCGTDIETIVVNAENCVAPTIAIQSAGSNVNTAAFLFAATVTNMPDPSGIQLTWNGQAINFNYDGLNLTSAVNLSSGLNTFVLTANRICGTSTKTLAITFNDCVTPQVVIQQPSAPGSTVNQPVYHFSALVSNISSSTTLNLTLNNVPVAFVLNNGKVTADLNLQPGVNNISMNASSACGFDTKTTNINFVNCVSPTISWASPNRPDAIVNQANFALNAAVTGITSNQSISLKHNNQLIPFGFANNTVTANVVLAPGLNTFTLSALNSCGTAIENTQVTLDNCVAPVLTLSNSTQPNATVSQANYTLNATVTGSVLNAAVSLMHNGISKPFNLNNGNISANLTLTSGQNTIALSAVNQCGNDLKTWTVQYVQCQNPTISLVNPAQSGLTVNRPALVFVAFAQNVSQASEINVKLNGQNISAFDFIGGKISAALTLVTGNNTITVSATTPCGTVTETYNITYSGCTQPSIIFENPAQAGVTVSNANFSFKAKVEQVSNLAGVVLKLNGNTVTGYGFNSGVLTANLTLQPGANTISLIATNDCGSLTQNTTINFDNCVPPTAQFTAPTQGLQVNIASFIVKASVQNVSNLQGITMKLNGNVLSGLTLVNGVVQAAVMLQPGINTFQLTATNACGTVNQSATVEFLNCTAPLIVITQPAENSTVTSSSFTFKATVQNMPSTQGLMLKLNGIPVQNASFLNGVVQAVVSLQNGQNNLELSAINACGNATKTATVTFDNCQAPTVSFTNPSNSGGSVNRPNFSLQANVLNMISTQGLSLKQNGTAITNFTFVNGQIQAAVTLQNGLNTFVLSAQNNCGTANETVTVNFSNCVSPTIAFVQPIGFNAVTNSASYSVKVNVQKVANPNSLEFKLNGAPIANASFVNGLVSADVQLVPGKNTFTLKATNECGSVTQSGEVTYNECLAPIVNILNPATNNSTVSNANFNFTAAVQNMASTQGLVVKLNGTTVSNLNFTNGQVQANLQLQTGLNTILISATNTCGTDTKSTTVTFDNCTPPTALFTNPTASGSSVNRVAFNLQANINNIGSAQGIVLKQNGNAITNFTFVAGKLSVPVNLVPGQNIFDLTVTNNCGTDNEVISVNFNDCASPVVAFTQPSQLQTNVAQASYQIKANIQNMTTSQGVALNWNGNAVNNFTFQNGVLQANVTLTNGLNTFVLSATNACGTISQTATVNFTPCNAPSVNIVNPNGGPTVTTPNFTFNGSVQNMNSTNGLMLTLNGSVVSNANFNNGLITANVALQPGSNTFVLSATNTCGTDSKTEKVTYENCVAPTVSFVSPNPTVSITTNNQFTVQALVQNVNSNQGVTLKHNGNPVSNFSFSNGQLQASITLVNGINNFMLSATNACGTVSDNAAIRLATCNQPVVVITQPTAGSPTVTVPNYTLTANIQNVGNPQAVQVTHNGNPVQGFSLSNGQLQANITLQTGANNFTVTATNNCGNDTKNASVSFNSCIAPTVAFTNPAPGTVSAYNPNFTIQATVQNINSPQQVELKLNGNVVSGVSVNNGQVAANVTLNSGFNQIQITVTNACGTDTKSASLRLSCPQPIISFIEPDGSNPTVTNANYQVRATLQNITSPQDVVVRLNGNAVSNVNFNNGQLTANVTLVNGSNNVSITASNTCGSNTQTSSVNLNSCVAPTVTFNSSLPSGSYTTQSSFSANIVIGNYNPNVWLIVRVNGVNVTNYNNNNGVITGNINLGFGTTTIEVIANSPCGSNQGSYTITRCKTASLTLVRPTSTNVTVSEQNQVFQFKLFNVENPQWLSIQFNNATFNNYQIQGELVSGMVSLNPGINTVRINVNTPCNQFTETITINYVVAGGGTMQPGSPGGNSGDGGSPRPGIRPTNNSGGGNNPGRTNQQQTQPSRTNTPTETKPSNPTRPNNQSETKPSEPVKPTNPTRPNNQTKPTNPQPETKPSNGTQQNEPEKKEGEGDKKPELNRQIKPGGMTRPNNNPQPKTQEKGGGK